MAGEEGRKPRSWSDLADVFLAGRGKPVPLQVERGGNLLATQIEPMAVPQERLTLAGAVGSPKYAPLPRIYNPLAAAKRGLKRTGLWLGRVYANLSQLVTREVSSKAIGGPVAIVQWSMGVAAHGVGTLMDFWGMLSVSIAVLNFLPIPPFDGGHVLFVLVEKVKGSPIGLRLRTIIWGAGWAAVGALFLLVMWQDIVRLFS
jgi:regulator of sigma E protease